MPRFPRSTAVLAVVAAFAAPAAAHAAKPSFKVTSSIDGKTVLPHRIRWIARPQISSRQVAEVDFLIDGKPAWTEKESPYVFSEDENGAHLGYLVTSWLKPGRHRFAVLVKTTDGRKATHGVTARVVAAPDVPAALAGTWRRAVPDTSGAPANGTPGNPSDTILPAGTYTMAIDSRMIQMRFPGTFHRPESDDTGAGWLLDSDFMLAGASLELAGPVIFRPSEDQAEGGWWCWQDGPTGAYSWAVTGSTLTLAPHGGADACGVRAFVFAGQWTRVG